MARIAAASGFIIRIAGDGLAGPVVAEVYGQPPDPELSQHEHRGISLLVFGHCLLSAGARAAWFANAVDRNEIRLIADWPGSYSAVVLRRGSVTAYADLAGQFPLYYSSLNGEILIGADPGMLASRHGRELDLVTAAARIACPSVLPLWAERSPYSGVRRLPGGAVLRVGSGELSVSPARLPMPVEGRTAGEGALMMRAALTDAVRDRCEGQVVSSDFSGGLDSTSIAFLAARYSPWPVTSIAYHQPLAPAGDLADAMRFAGLDPRIALAVVGGSTQTLPFTGLADALRDGRSFADAIPWSPEPGQGALASSRTALRLAAASLRGASLHLTGEGGDALLLAAPSYLARLVRPRTARTLLRHCGAYARLRYVSPASLAVRSIKLARTSAARALRDLAAELEHPDRRLSDWGDVIAWWPSCGEAAGWLTPRIRRQLAGIAGDPVTARGVPNDVAAADLAALTDLRQSGEAQRQVRELARPFGVTVHAPFLDSAVVRAALSVPASARADPWSYKPLLRAAMAGMVPDEVLSRRSKGDYSAEAYRGAREASAALRELLRDSRLAALGVIEPGAVSNAIDRMTAGVAVPLGPLHMVLATETWLRGADDVKTRALAAC
jgi:asparagine synthase (glutamine-hydrolysing)